MVNKKKQQLQGLRFYPKKCVVCRVTKKTYLMGNQAKNAKEKTKNNIVICVYIVLFIVCHNLILSTILTL
jgi:hypothetical protein